MVNARLVGSLLVAAVGLSTLVVLAQKQDAEVDKICAEMDQLAVENKNDGNVEALLQKDLAQLNKLPISDIRRLRANAAMVRYYARTKNAVAGAEAQRAMTQYMDELIKTPNLSASVLTRGGTECDSLADIFAVRFHPFRGADVQAKAGPKDFALAEGYRLQSLALYDRLPDKDINRIMAHRAIVLWYRHYGRDKEATAQTDRLAKLLGSNKPEVLFPPPPPCPACGMG